MVMYVGRVKRKALAAIFSGAVYLGQLEQHSVIYGHHSVSFGQNSAPRTCRASRFLNQLSSAR